MICRRRYRNLHVSHCDYTVRTYVCAVQFLSVALQHCWGCSVRTGGWLISYHWGHRSQTIHLLLAPPLSHSLSVTQSGAPCGTFRRDTRENYGKHNISLVASEGPAGGRRSPFLCANLWFQDLCQVWGHMNPAQFRYVNAPKQNASLERNL